MVRDFQNAFVRIATDQVFRQGFFRDFNLALGEYDLTEKERRALEHLEQPQVDRYAQSLCRKRWREISGVIALTQRVCPDLRARYWEWLGENPSRVAEHHLTPGVAEALRALPALHRSLRYDGSQAPYAADLLAFETLSAASKQDGIPRQLKSRYPLHQIAAEVRNGLIAMDVEISVSLYRFERQGVRWKGEQ